MEMAELSFLKINITLPAVLGLVDALRARRPRLLRLASRGKWVRTIRVQCGGTAERGSSANGPMSMGYGLPITTANGMRGSEWEVLSGCKHSYCIM